MFDELTSRLRHHAQTPVHLRCEHIGDGVERIRLETPLTRFHGMESSLYRLGNILVDTGFSNAREPLLAHLASEKIDIIACTHHHEDHTGNAAVLAAMNRCPVYLRNAQCALDEGVVDMARYREWYWGPLDRFEYTEMPDAITSGRTLVPIPIPGHSVTHTALFERATGLVFTGDLFITGGVTAIMDHENPYDSIESLRSVASLEPSRMLTGHGLIVEDPASTLTLKADRIEEATALVRRLHTEGASVRQIRAKIFSRKGWQKDILMQTMTGEEFCRDNFVKAVIRHAPG